MRQDTPVISQAPSPYNKKTQVSNPKRQPAVDNPEKFQLILFPLITLSLLITALVLIWLISQGVPAVWPLIQQVVSGA
jgi:hypothetical protein